MIDMRLNIIFGLHCLRASCRVVLYPLSACTETDVVCVNFSECGGGCSSLAHAWSKREKKKSMKQQQRRCRTFLALFSLEEKKGLNSSWGKKISELAALAVVSR